MYFVLQSYNYFSVFQKGLKIGALGEALERHIRKNMTVNY